MAYTNSNSKAIRIDALDYLRGLAAFGILLYHLHLFSFGEVDASEVLAKVKIYGVSIFYILSGLTLYIVYGNRLSISRADLTDFYIKRFFRIVPLLWLVTILTVFMEYGYGNFLDRKVILNLMVLPGIIKPENLLANGAWSIGNELFFYLIFPFIIYMLRAKRAYGIVMGIVALVPFLYFTFYKLDPNESLGVQWGVYVNPLNQVLYFFLGILMGLVFDPQKFRKSSLIVLVAALSFVLFYPAQGEPVVLVTGVNRLVLGSFIALTCLLFYKSNFEFLPQLVTEALKSLGEISYSLYLLHPLVFIAVKTVFDAFGASSPFGVILVSIAASILVSYANYTYFEKYFIRIGKLVNKRFTRQPL